MLRLNYRLHQPGTLKLLDAGTTILLESEALVFGATSSLRFLWSDREKLSTSSLLVPGFNWFCCEAAFDWRCTAGLGEDLVGE